MCVSIPNSSIEINLADTVAYTVPCEMKNLYICDH